MTLRELLDSLASPDHIDAEKALDLEVEFCTINQTKMFHSTDKTNLALLSVYEDEGRIIINVGTKQ